ncbi:hypothetical protein SUDANB95_07923 (plasmid) [Actinosynnema sp. ALI-1.44]
MTAWSQEAAGHARLITELVRAGVITDEVIAGLGGDTDYLLERRRRAERLWEETAVHAHPHRWLEEIDEQNPDEVLGELELIGGLRVALASAASGPVDEGVVRALVRLHRADVVNAAHAQWAADSDAVQRLVELGAGFPHRADGTPDRMTLTLTNRDEMAAWIGEGARRPDDLGSDVLLVNTDKGTVVIPLGATVERTLTGFRILTREEQVAADAVSRYGMTPEAAARLVQVVHLGEHVVTMDGALDIVTEERLLPETAVETEEDVVRWVADRFGYTW